MTFEACDWCGGTKLVTLWHKRFTGDRVMYLEDVDRQTGEVIHRRVPGIVTIHCRECPLGEHAYLQFPEEERRKLWTTRHFASQRPNALQRDYGPTDPTYEARFRTEAAAVRWMASLGRAETLGDAMDAIGEAGRAEVAALAGGA